MQSLCTLWARTSMCVLQAERANIFGRSHLCCAVLTPVNPGEGDVCILIDACLLACVGV